jgi:hypothetical protein
MRVRVAPESILRKETLDVRKISRVVLGLALTCFVCWRAAAPAHNEREDMRAAQAVEQERVAKIKQTLLGRVKRNKPEYRGDPPGLRFKSEWIDEVADNYVFQKNVLLNELAVSEKYPLRATWVYKDMKVTFQEIFNLGPEDDDKLFPLSYGNDLIGLAPSSSFEGLALLGKGAEVKGPYTVKVVVNRFILTDYIGSLLKYTNKEGKERFAIGAARDAFTVRWKDIKNRIADDMSEANELEYLRLQRERVSADIVVQDRY